jgi:hypothetical protein
MQCLTFLTKAILGHVKRHFSPLPSAAKIISDFFFWLLRWIIKFLIYFTNRNKIACNAPEF